MRNLEASYAYCVGIARARARNFYYSFLVLPKEKRLAMCAIYAFMRQCDDISDEPRTDGGGRAALDAWRAQLDDALAGQTGAHALWPAFADTASRYRIPARYFHEMIDGVGSDLEPRRIATFEDLYRYCYLVASVVGLTTIHIFGFEDARALGLAEKCGIAFQLTNIIRDVREDAENGRVYLPAEDLDRFGVRLEALRGHHTSGELQRLLEYEGQRAHRYYEEARPLINMVEADSRSALWALIEIYSRLLDRIAARHYDVMPANIRLSTVEKLSILAQGRMKRRG
jgi:phytoene synthase